MNFSLRSALECACALALVAGCGGNDDGLKDLAAAEAALAVPDLAKADKHIAKSLAAAPESADALVTGVKIKLALGQIPEADALVKRAAVVAGTDADVRLLDAQVAYHLQDYDRAAASYRAILNEKSTPDPLRSQAYAGLGVVEMTRNSFAAARVALLKAIRADRHNASARYHLGYLYRSAFGYLEAALEEFEIYVRLETKDAEHVRKVQRGTIKDIKDEIANQAVNRPGAAKRDSAASARALAKAETFAKAGNWKAARGAYKEAFDADVLSFPAAAGLAKAIEMSDSSAKGREQALGYYKTASSLRPSSSRNLMKTAELAMALGHPVTAAEAYSRAFAANPTDRAAIDGLVRALRKSGGRAAEATIYQSYLNDLPKRKK